MQSESLSKGLTTYTGLGRRTLEPKYGIPLGVQYTTTIGFAELRDYHAFFRGERRPVDPRLARSLRASADDGVIFFPRRAFDLWNTRYFVLPSFPNKWSDRSRAFAAFLDRTEQVYPPPDAFKGPDGREKFRDWIRTSDFQVRRNLADYPRAWVVHRATPVRDDLTPEERRLDPAGVEDILFTEEDR